ncbi:MAG: kynureninase, partial [Angustibacter sp.]
MTAELARHLDETDPLAPARELFELPEDLIYLCGNSLGALPRVVRTTVAEVITRQWGEHLVSAWSRDDWWTAPERVGNAVAPLLGAAADQIVVTDSTSINLFKCYLAATRLRPERKIIVTDPRAFPTDQYLLTSAARLADIRIISATPPEVPGVLAAHGSDVCLVSLSHVDFR